MIQETKNLDSTIVAKEGKISNLSEQPHIIVYNGSRFLYNKKIFSNKYHKF